LVKTEKFLFNSFCMKQLNFTMLLFRHSQSWNSSDKTTRRLQKVSIYAWLSLTTTFEIFWSYSFTFISPSYKIIESIPQNVNITAAHEVYKAWIEAFNKATKSIDIAAFYFSLTDGKEWPPSNGRTYTLKFVVTFHKTTTAATTTTTECRIWRKLRRERK
jgi:hypothetical protein